MPWYVIPITWLSGSGCRTPIFHHSFRNTKALTLEKFTILHKIEKVKELIEYGVPWASEIALHDGLQQRTISLDAIQIGDRHFGDGIQVTACEQPFRPRQCFRRMTRLRRSF